MRRFVSFTLTTIILGAALALTACTANGTPCATQDWPPLRIAVANPGNLKPGERMIFATNGLTELPLVDLDPKGRVIPGIAREWQTTDRRTWTFTLRAGGHTHDGTRLTSEYIRGEILRRIAGMPKLSAVWRDLDAIDTPTSLSMVFRFKAPVSMLPEQLVLINNQKGTKEPGDTSAGPWHITKDGDNEMELVATPPPPPGAARLTTLHVGFYPSARAAYAAFLRHETDLLFEVPAAAVPALAQNPDIRIFGGDLRRVATFGFNLQHPLLRDVRVRQAINLAIDRDELVQRLYGGHPALVQKMKPVMGPFSPTYWALDGLASPWHYDRAAARALLKEATGGHEQPIELTCLTSSEFAEAADMTVALEAQLQRVRIQLQLEPLPLKALTARIESGNYDTFVTPILTNWGGVLPYLLYHSGGRAAGFYRDSQYSTADAALDRLYRADSDDAERAAVRDVIDALYTDPPAAFLIPMQHIRAVRNTWRVPDDEVDIRRSFSRWRFDAPCGGS